MTQWRALLEGEMLPKAEAVLDEIAEALRGGAEPTVRRDVPPQAVPMSLNCLANGITGQALFWGYREKSDAGTPNAGLAVGLLNQAIEVASAGPMNPSLFGGFGGIVWTVEHLTGRLFAAAGEDPYRDIDEVLSESISGAVCPYHYDLIGGLAGMGVYALERLPRPSARRCLEAIVDRLAAAAQRGPEGTTWLTPVGFLTDDQQARFPRGSYCVGMAHGVPGVVGLLAEPWAANVARDKVGPLLEAAVAWILAQAQPPGSTWRFPSWVGFGNQPSRSRLGWCYGDPGVAAALLAGAAAMDREDWRQEAITTALVGTRRPLEDAAVNDACLCHGTAGLAHIYNRLYQASGEEALAEAARFWYEKLLADHKPGQGCGGYAFVHMYDEGPASIPDPGFLMGASGVGLALQAAVTEVEPQWDRVLLTNIPVRRPPCG